MKRLFLTCFVFLALCGLSQAEIERYNSRLPMMIYKGRESPYVLTLSSEGTKLTQAEIEAITKAAIIFNNETTDSDTCAACFDFGTGYKENGQILVDFGTVDFTSGRDRTAELIIYNASYPNGRVFGTLDIEVSDAAAEGASLVEALIEIVLNTLSDVEITDPQDNEILIYNSSTGNWENGENTGATGSDDQTASEVETTVTNFDNNLSAADDTVQKALETLDEVAGGGGSTDPDDLNGDTVDDNLVDVAIMPTASPSNADTTHVSNGDQIYDFVMSRGFLTAEVDGSTTNEIEVVDETYNATNFNGGTTSAVSQDDFYDLWHGIDTDDDGDIDVMDSTVWATKSDSSHNHSGIYAAALGSDDNYVTDAEKVVIGNTSGTNSGDDDVDDEAIHDNVAGEIAAITEKETPASADVILIEDSENSNVKRRVEIGNLPGGGGSTAYDDIADPDADTTIAMAGYESVWTSTLNEANHIVQMIHNTVADLTADVYLLVLQFTDDGDANGIFLDCRDNAGDSKFKVGADGAVTASGALSGGNVTSGENPGHTHTGASLSGVDMSDDTNLSGGRSMTMNGDAVDADAELYTDSKCIYIEDPTADDDLKSIWRAPVACTITGIWAESDQTVTFMLQVDDGTPSDVDTVDLAPAAGTAEDTSLNGDTTMAAGDRLDIDLVSVSGTPTWVTIHWTFTKDD